MHKMYLEGTCHRSKIRSLGLVGSEHLSSLGTDGSIVGGVSLI